MLFRSLLSIEEEYTDRLIEIRRTRAIHPHWVLEAATMFFQASSDVFIRSAIHRVLRRIYVNSKPTRKSHGPMPRKQRTLMCRNCAANDATSQSDPSYFAPNPHPASPLLLFCIFLARKSKEMSIIMLETGLLTLLQSLFDEPSTIIHSRRTFPVSGTSRQIMHQLSLELLVQISKHVDLRDCTIKQELRDEVVAASRATSARYFDIRWREVIGDNPDTSRPKQTANFI